MNHKPRDLVVTTSVPTVVGGLGLALALLLGGCSSDTAESSAPASTPAASAAADSTDTDAGAAGATGATGDWNDVDVAFVEMMVPHHTQALLMTDLAEQHASRPDVRALAERIRGAQGPEVLLMSSWLDEQGIEPAEPMSDMEGTEGTEGMEGMDGGSMDMSSMGMLTDDQLDELAAARGADFDRLFLEGMVRHHQGAIDMAAEVLAGGSDVRVNELAAEVTQGQSAEIARMQEMLAVPVP